MGWLVVRTSVVGVAHRVLQVDAGQNGKDVSLHNGDQQLDSRELPDHLPLYLEYLAQLPKSKALGGLQDIAPILALLSARLQQRGSRYAVLFDLLLKLANTVIDSDKVAEKIADEARDDTPQALDAVWEEEQVKFFADQGCGESEISAHQRRFAGAVAPQYLNITTGGQH